MTLGKGTSVPTLETRHAASVVAVAASAGGLNALGRLLGELPADFPAAILVVQHLDPRYPSFMAQILGRRTRLVVFQARDGQVIQPGTVYVAPPNHHLGVGPDFTIALSQSAEVHHVRPSADILFDSVAARYGPRAVAVVLSGSGSDGSDGVTNVKKAGGIVIVQSARSAEFGGMPEAAIRTGVADLILDLPSIPRMLTALVERPEA